eukprot:16440166-Heterocapsa_arctica.AAC.1
MIHTYERYITNRLVRKDVDDNAKVKGTKTGTIGRPNITLEQMGHEVHICGDTEYCLGCGRNANAKHIDTAKHVFWRKPCQACKAVGPDMSKGTCKAYDHKRGSTHYQDTCNKRHKNSEEDKCPGTWIRRQAMIEAEQKHKDVMFLKQTTRERAI